ncbi:Protein bem46 [Taphrina deformans PYCC 5710]|uniref:Protein bem46 n=1 Tax=Taphrina deformans (strain PYCC 5710 / ATCC 11124 / CBS 356.35 / IMI 108563 / JCM 9778 / NBRC 8474) TaxID=1097556 RepID=R4X708_TAPDE|nr:Protein bem46 [Taphrina deformans PYCC 5710]|eukprot:CCG80813.1 Protein bem46 [Taphrina deformans PYCC 5710]
MSSLASCLAIFKWIAALAGGSIALIGTGLYIFQTSIIYPASIPQGSRTIVDNPGQYGMDGYETVMLDTPDGQKLHCYLIMQDPALAPSRPTVLLFHANAGNMGHRLPIARVFHNQMKLNVVMLSYRGYGKSTGTANEVGIKIDARVFLQYILDHKILGRTKLFAYGQSIGGAVALDIVSRNHARFSGLIIENTFLSIRTLIPSVLPMAAPIARLCHQRWDSEAIIDTIHLPALFLSGRKDEIVPSSQMDRLYQLCTSPKKEWHEFPNGTHNDTVAQKDYMKHIYDFIVKSTSS